MFWKAMRQELGRGVSVGYGREHDGTYKKVTIPLRTGESLGVDPASK